MKRKESFDKMAMLYDKVRPSYPNQLIKDIIEKTQITLNERLLEIGAGTGKATIQFAKKGFNIDCIEMGQNLADILKVKCYTYPKVKVDVSTFEQWEPKDNKAYDLIYSAQAFHWIDKKIKFKKCHNLLKEDGHLALFWYQNSDESTEVLDDINSMINNNVPDFFDNEVDKDSYIENMELRKFEIIESGFFNNLEIIEYTLDNTIDAEKYIQSINTYSKFAILSDRLKSKLIEEIQRIINNHGGHIDSKIVYSLYLAKKR